MVLRRLVSALALVGLASASLAQEAPQPPPQPLPRADPAAMGFSPERLARIGTVLDREVAEGRMPGAVLIIAREGRVVFHEAYGFRDKAAGAPMPRDALFNIASMTKPMTAVAVLGLAERGDLVLDDPVSAYLPGRFTEQRVASLDLAGKLAGTVPAARPVSLRDLLTHTSGLVYGGRGTTEVHRMLPAGSVAAAKDLDGDRFLDALQAAPLLHQPGTVWDYGFGLDVAGLVVERLTGRTLDAHLAETVFGPLGMRDTGFVIPPGSADRYARALPEDPATGKPQVLEPDATRPTRFACGGGCAVSSAEDYLRFALALMNEGELGGRRVLSPVFTRAMLTDQLGPGVRNLIGNADPTRADYGFGLGLAVRTRPGVVRLLGSVGDFSWPGSSGTNWWVDPGRKLAVVFMAHTPGTARWRYRYLINSLVYQALER